MSTALARLGITVPEAGDAVLAFSPSTDIEALGVAVDTLAVIHDQGALVDRPAAGVAGRIWKVTGSEDNLIYWDNGSSWVTIGAAAPSDPAAGTPGLRTLGGGPLQAAAGNHGHATSALTDADSALLLPGQWGVPGAEVPGLTGSPVSVAAGAGAVTVVAGPASGRRVVKALTVSAPSAGMTVTFTLASLTLARLSFSSAGHAEISCVLPIAATENLQATVTGGTSVITPRWGDRADTTLTRLTYTSTSGSATLIASGTARTINQMWVANPSSSATASFSLAIDGTTIKTVALPVSGMYHLDSPVPLTSAQALTCVGDGVTALTYMIAGR